tara:strand:+ start:155 stop:274 length:120 start_codon:yes stop_codon:yes gene_type:complete
MPRIEKNKMQRNVIKNAECLEEVMATFILHHKEFYVVPS